MGEGVVMEFVYCLVYVCLGLGMWGIQWLACVFFHWFLMEVIGMCRLWSSSRLFVLMAPQTPTMITLRGFNIHVHGFFFWLVVCICLFCLSWLKWCIYCGLIWFSLFIWKGWVWVLVGLCFVVAPCMYMMSSHNLARHAHLEVLHMQCSIHGEMVLPWGVLFIVPALVSVKWRVCMHDFSTLVSCRTTTLCLAIQGPLRNNNIIFVKMSHSHVTLFFQGQLSYKSCGVHFNFVNNCILKLILNGHLSYKFIK